VPLRPIRISAAAAAAVLAVAVLGVASPAAAVTRDTDDSCPPGILPSRFFDVLDESTHVAAIDCVLHWRVALGTSSERYAPATAVTRAQMATFLARLVTASGTPLPVEPPDAFDDDDDSQHESAIDALAALGVVGGKGARRYDPHGVVTREQMASFLVRAHDATGAAPLPAGPDAFDDDGGSTHEPAIDRAAAAGFAGGTGDRRYGPGGPVRREQMAAFLVRVLDKVVEDGAARAPAVPDLDPACSGGASGGEFEAAACEFAWAVQSGDLTTLGPEERAAARAADDLPAGAWTVESCDLVGDITVLCELAFPAEQTYAGLYLQPANGEYDGQGGVDVPPGEELRAAVVEYAGTGPSGSFGP
jgi:hypothetical protein